MVRVAGDVELLVAAAALVATLGARSAACPTVFRQKTPRRNVSGEVLRILRRAAARDAQRALGAAAGRVVAERRGLAEPDLVASRCPVPRRPAIAERGERAVQVRRALHGLRADDLVLRAQPRAQVRLVPDRPQLDGRVARAERAHERAEELWIGLADAPVRRASRRSARPTRGSGRSASAAPASRAPARRRRRSRGCRTSLRDRRRGPCRRSPWACAWRSGEGANLRPDHVGADHVGAERLGLVERLGLHRRAATRASASRPRSATAGRGRRGREWRAAAAQAAATARTCRARRRDVSLIKDIPTPRPDRSFGASDYLAAE